MFEFIQRADEWMMLFVQDHIRCGALNIIMKIVTFAGDGGAIWFALCAVLLAFKKTRKSGVGALAAMAFSWCMSELVLKYIVCRSRPFIMLDGLDVLIDLPLSYSFPSSHTCTSFAVAYVMAASFGKKGAWAYVPAALIAISRVYVGVHYPTDVIAGGCLGTLCAMLTYQLISKYVHIRDHKIVVKRRETNE